LKIIGSPVLATLLTFSIFALTGHPVNLLHIVSSFLILGIGVDYTIFFTEGRQITSVTGLAVLLSALTTLLSFGLLFLSQTPGLEAVGLTVALGIGFSLLLSPLALPDKVQQEKGS
jgi:predicted exporter